MTELAALNVRITGDSQSLSTAIAAANGDLAKLVSGAQAAGLKVKALEEPLRKAGKAASGAGVGVQQFGWQFSQMGQSIAAGTPPLNAFTMQLGDLLPMLGIGGLAGVAITATAVLLPLAGAFLSGKEAADEFGEALDRLSAATGEVREISRMAADDIIAKYGAITVAITEALEKQREFAINEQMDAARDAIAGLSTGVVDAAENIRRLQENIAALEAMSLEEAMSLGVDTAESIMQANEAIGVFEDQLGLTAEQAIKLDDALASWRAADSLYDKAVAAGEVLKAIEGTSLATTQWARDLNAAQLELFAASKATVDLHKNFVLVKAALDRVMASIPKAGWLDGAISGAAGLASTLWDAAAAAAAVGGGTPVEIPDDRSEAIRENRAGVQDALGVRLKRTQSAWLNPPKGGGGGGGSGGGGGGENPIIGELEALQESLMTQEEAQLASFTRQQETLQAALAQRLITQQEYNAMMEAAQMQHSEAMAEIDVMRYGTGLEKAAEYFGAIAGVMASGNKKMMAISQVFGAGQALISTYIGAAKELEKGTFGFASAMAVIAKGLGFVSAIKGVGGSGGGGGGRGGASSAAAGPSQMPMQVQLNTYGAGDFIRGADFGLILDRLNSEAGDRGYNLMWRPT